MSDNNATTAILYCRCAYANVVPRNVKDEVLSKLVESGRAFDSVADLCEMSAKCDPSLQQITGQKPLKIAACYPRAVKWLFAAADAPLPAEDVTVLNMRTDAAQDVVDELLQTDHERTEEAT